MSGRSVLEKTYSDVCTVYSAYDETHRNITRQKRVALYEAVPCALSHRQSNPADQSESEKIVSYTHKLFINPEMIVFSGCEITVERYGRKYHFTAVGEPFVYETHQEILLSAKQRA